MVERVFHKHVGPSMLAYEPASRQIIFATPMYDPKLTRQVVREVTIDEEEWQAIVKYGEDAGFSRS